VPLETAKEMDQSADGSQAGDGRKNQISSMCALWPVSSNSPICIAQAGGLWAIFRST